MDALNVVVRTLVRAVISIRHLISDRFDIAAQFVRDHDARLPEALDQFFQETPGHLGISARLKQDIKYITFAINRTPKPVLHAVDWDNDPLVHVSVHERAVLSSTCHLSAASGRSRRTQSGKWLPSRLTQSRTASRVT